MEFLNSKGGSLKERLTSPVHIHKILDRYFNFLHQSQIKNKRINKDPNDEISKDRYTLNAHGLFLERVYKIELDTKTAYEGF